MTSLRRHSELTFPTPAGIFGCGLTVYGPVTKFSDFDALFTKMFLTWAINSVAGVDQITDHIGTTMTSDPDHLHTAVARRTTKIGTTRISVRIISITTVMEVDPLDIEMILTRLMSNFTELEAVYQSYVMHKMQNALLVNLALRLTELELVEVLARSISGRPMRLYWPPLPTHGVVSTMFYDGRRQPRTT